MRRSSNRNSIAKSLILSLLGAGACSGPPSSGVEATAPMPQVTAVGTASPDIAEAAARAYVEALLNRDSSALKRVASRELLDRIDTRGPAGTFEEKMGAFLESEGRKLLREFEESPARPQSSEARTTPSISIRAVELKEGIASVMMSLGERELSKALYLVGEDGGFKMNVVAPVSPNSSSHYLVENWDNVVREFECTGFTHWIWEGGYGHFECIDSCPGFWDGTTFTAGGRSVKCDYNTWGVDMRIIGGLPYCNDPC